jgi:hypothetical protein
MMPVIHPHHVVGAAAGGERDDDLDRLRRVLGLRQGGAGNADEQRERRSGRDQVAIELHGEHRVEERSSNAGVDDAGNLRLGITLAAASSRAPWCWP